MRVLDLFSGLGGFALAAQTAFGDRCKHVGFCEIDPFCQQVLRKRFPAVPLWSDIHDLPLYGVLQGNVDLLCAGWPCHGHSQAGLRKGLSDHRSGLAHVLLDVVDALKPPVLLLENVRAVASSGLDVVVGKLQEIGYGVQVFDLGAEDVGAPHRRRRVFLFCTLGGDVDLRPFLGAVLAVPGQGPGADNRGWVARPREDQRVWEPSRLWQPPPDLPRRHPLRTWRRQALHAIGNAVVPQCPAAVLRALDWLFANEGVLPADQPVEWTKVVDKGVPIHRPRLPTTAGQWPTPMTTDKNDVPYQDSRGIRYPRLLGVARGDAPQPMPRALQALLKKTQWATPNAKVANEQEPLESWFTRTASVAKADKHLVSAPLGIQVKAWATPAARDWRSGHLDLSVQRAGSRQLPEQVVAVEGVSGTGVLNPEFVEMLMGFPRGWTDVSR